MVPDATRIPSHWLGSSRTFQNLPEVEKCSRKEGYEWGKESWKERLTQLGVHTPLQFWWLPFAVVFYGCLVGEAVRHQRSLISSA